MTALFTFLIIIAVTAFLIFSLNKKGVSFIEIFKVYDKDFQNFFKGINESKDFKSLFTFKIITLYLSAFLFLILFISSFIPTIFTNGPLTGLFLIIHVTIAPLFAILAAIMVVFYSFKLKFNSEDFQKINNLKEFVENKQETSIKLSFWLITIFTSLLLISIILILYPILGTELQEFYITIHRISATVITVLILFILYLNVLKKKHFR